MSWIRSYQEKDILCEAIEYKGFNIKIFCWKEIFFEVFTKKEFHYEIWSKEDSENLDGDLLPKGYKNREIAMEKAKSHVDNDKWLKTFSEYINE